MPKKMPSKVQADEYESDDFEETETLISRSKVNRPKSSLGFSLKRSSKKGKKRPVTPGRRSQSAQGYRPRSGKELWMNAIKNQQTLLHSNSRHGESPRHKTPIEYWVETLRKTGYGRSTESTRMNTFSGLQNANEKFYPYMSTSHYMRQAMGTEKAGRHDDPTVKPSQGRPAYKTPEEYYEEVLELRKQIGAMNVESATMKTKIRRLEEDNQKKGKEINNLLHPEQSEEIRRTLGDRKPDSGAVIHSLKQKILKLEVQLRDRESSNNKLKADLKVTKIEEMKEQLEAFYQEIVRLQNVKSSSSTKAGSENSVKVKALNETILRLSRTNEQLLQENGSLKEDLGKALNAADIKPDLERDHEDKNRRELLLSIATLERKVEKYERMETDSVSGAGRDSAAHSKLVLRGSTEERLSQLDQRESELLDEIHRLKSTIKRLRDDRAKRGDRDDRESLPPTPTPRRRASRDVGSVGGSRPSSAQRPSTGQRPSSGRRDSVMSEDRARKVDNFRQTHAASNIQRHWRNRRQKQNDMDQDEKVRRFTENHAAKKLQHEWLGYKHRRNEEEVDDATFTIQAALHGHQARQKRMRIYHDTESPMFTDDDEDVNLIQSSLKGHHARLENMKNLRLQRYDSYEEEDQYYDTKTPGHSRRSSSSLQRPSSAKGPGRKPSPSVHSFKPRYSNGMIGQNGDDDDDIMT